MFYRADQFKSRDIFDLAVVLEHDQRKLQDNLQVFFDKIPVLLDRCQLLKKIYKEELKQLIVYKDEKFIRQSYDKAIAFLEKCKV